MAQKLSIILMGRRYDISLLEAHSGVQEQCAWLHNGNIDIKDLLKAYIEKCQEYAELESQIENLSNQLEEWL